MSFSDYLELQLLDHVFGGGTYTKAGTVYVALSSTTVTDAGGITEPTGGSYARVPVVNNATNWPNAAPVSTVMTKSNGVAITFPVATADWAAAANLTYVLIYDAASAGNLLGWGALTTPKPVLNGDTASFAIGTLSITLD